MINNILGRRPNNGAIHPSGDSALFGILSSAVGSEGCISHLFMVFYVLHLDENATLAGAGATIFFSSQLSHVYLFAGKSFTMSTSTDNVIDFRCLE